MTTKPFTLLLLTIAACGNSDDQDRVKTCTPPSGVYNVHYAEQPGGNCGPIPDLYIDTSQTLAAQAGGTRCDGPDAVDSTCHERTVQRCSDGAGKSWTQVGDADWAPDGSGATGSATYAITFPNGQTCSSQYVVTVVRR